MPERYLVFGSMQIESVGKKWKIVDIPVVSDIQITRSTK